MVSRSSINLHLEIVSNHELHEDPDFVPIIVHEEVVDLVAR